MSWPVPAVTEKNKTRTTPSTRKCQQNHVSNQWRKYTTLVPHFSILHTARVKQTSKSRQRPQTSTIQVFCESVDSSVKKWRPHVRARLEFWWRSDGVSAKFALFTCSIKNECLSKTALGRTTQQKEVWWLNNIWKRVMVYKMRCAVFCVH